MTRPFAVLVIFASACAAPAAPIVAPAPAIALAAAPTDAVPLPWLVGRWRGQNNGKLGEEAWGASVGGVMVGTSTVLGADGGPVFFELATVTREKGAPVLRIRHFSKTLVAYEEKDAPFLAHAEKLAPGEAVFALDGDPNMKRISYRRTDGGSGTELTITLERQAGGQDEYRFTRAAP